MRRAASEHVPGPFGYDAELRRHNGVLRRAAGVQLQQHALDIGSGSGQTTREAARTARAREPVYYGPDVATALSQMQESRAA